MTRFSVSRRNTVISFFVPVTFCLIAFAIAARLASAQGLGPGRYEIQNAASDKFMDVDRSDGITVRQWESNRQKSQQWEIENAGNGYVHIRSAENGMVLDIAGGVPRDEARLILNRPNGSETQLWSVEDAGEGLVRISSRFGKCIDVPDASRDNGVRWQLWRPIEKYAEKFRLVPVRGGPARDRDDRPAGFDRDGRGDAGRGDTGRGDTGSAEKETYHQGYSLGMEDAQAHLRRSYARHKGQYNPERQDAFVEGYYDGYDSGRTDTNEMMQPMEKQSYDLGYRFGRQDYQQRNSPNYTRYADRFDTRSEPYFRRGYESGYNPAR
jgi:hypothetical protein